MRAASTQQHGSCNHAPLHDAPVTRTDQCRVRAERLLQIRSDQLRRGAARSVPMEHLHLGNPSQRRNKCGSDGSFVHIYPFTLTASYISTWKYTEFLSNRNRTQIKLGNFFSPPPDIFSFALCFNLPCFLFLSLCLLLPPVPLKINTRS